MTSFGYKKNRTNFTKICLENLQERKKMKKKKKKMMICWQMVNPRIPTPSREEKSVNNF